MSTYYGYHCRTCKQSSDYWLNHGDAALQEALDAWPTIIKPAIDLGRKSGWIEVDISILGTTTYVYDDTPIGFLDCHDGHTVVLEDEYGQQSDPVPPSGVSTEGAAWAMESHKTVI